MKPTWSKCVRELLIFHEMFRKLGFPPGELFVLMYQTGQVQFQLQHRGELFTVDLYKNQDIGAIQEEWGKAVAWWNSEATEEERQELYQNSDAVKGAVGLSAALAVRGLYPIKPLKEEESPH